MKRINLFIISLLAVLLISACGSTSDNKDATAGKESNNKSEVAEVVDEKEEIEIPFNLEDFVVDITPNGNINSADGVEFAFTVQNNSPIPVREFSADVKFELEDGQSMIDTVEIYTTILAGETVGDSTENIYPEPASLIKSYEVIAYDIIDEGGLLYEVDLQLNTIDISNHAFWDITEELPFNIEDFTIEITPNGQINSAGGVELAYEIQNNFDIPVKEIRFDVLMEFENGIKQVESISQDNTLMNGENIKDSDRVYPEPASKMKSYKVIGYQIKDKDNNGYDVDTQLGIVEAY
ncbi:hypothetical protein [Lederbergia graminis]|uniref:Uncharacterized protein n=1 Tax=Lederbergia graminis TaxID=735518 RepID=A0ABW0LLQ9_9BACI